MQNERLKEFGSVLSYDLRSPLNVAQGNVELALETGEREPLETAPNALTRISDLVDAVL